MKKFYNREAQLNKLRDISKHIADSKGRLSVVVGRRRVGKTRLLNEAFSASTKEIANKNNYLYLFISRKSEAVLVDEFATIIKNKFDAKFFQPNSLKDIFEYLFHYATTQPLTLVVDEFQDIEKVNSNLFSDLQNLWDSYKNTTMMHFVCCGSLYSLMTKIFKGDKQPLLNRDDHFFKIPPLSPTFIRQVMVDQNRYSAESMLLWWCLSGGIPKYLEWLSNTGENALDDVDSDTSNREIKLVFDELISSSSPLIKEGVHRLVEDFGSEHRTYFDVLGAIANGYTARSRIENYLNIGIGTILQNLESDFDIIAKMRPITSKENSRDIRYKIVDPFLRFWFKFIYSNRSAVEMENFDYIKKVLNRDFETFSGIELEALCESTLIESKQFNRIGSYWDNKGENEIDIVAINDFDKRILIVEVKRQFKRYSHNKLVMKSSGLLSKLKLKDYQIDYQCFSLDNLDEWLSKLFSTEL